MQDIVSKKWTSHIALINGVVAVFDLLFLRAGTHNSARVETDCDITTGKGCFYFYFWILIHSLVLPPFVAVSFIQLVNIYA